MAETRMQPRIVSRSTGIDQTTGQVNRPNNAAGSNATSHVSAAPGVSARAHQHVVNARNPSGVPNARGPATAPPRGGKGQDATVQLIERPGSQPSGAAPVSSVSSVQLMGPRPQAGQIDDPLTVDELDLIGSLVDKYAERMAAVNDDKNLGMSLSALDKLAKMRASTIAATTRGGAQVSARPSETASAQTSTTIISAQTSTTIVSGPPAAARGAGPIDAAATRVEADDELEVDQGSGHGHGHGAA